MAARKPRRRKWRIAMIGLILFLLLATVTLPVWFPWVLRPLLRSAHVTYESYETIGYTRCALSGVRFQKDRTEIHARHVELSLPNRWLWDLCFAGKSRQPDVRVADWNYLVNTNPPTKVSQINSTSRVLDTASDWWARLGRWLAAAQLTNGVVQVAGREILVPVIDWQNGVMSAVATVTNMDQALSVRAAFPARNKATLDMKLSPADAEAAFTISRQPAAWQFTGTARWQTNRLEAHAVFGDDGWAPMQAHVETSHFQLPARWLRLHNYQDITAAVSLDWQTNQFELASHGTAPPKAVRAFGAPPVAFALKANGTLEAITLDQFTATAPWFQARLLSPVNVQFRSGAIAAPAELDFSMDLGALGWTNASGSVAGTLHARPQGTNLLSAAMDLQGTNVMFRDVSAQKVSLRGRLNWPWLFLERGEAEFEGDSSASATARLNLESLTVTNGSWRLQGGWFERFMPTNSGYATLQSTGEFHGTFTNLVHSGRLKATGLFTPRLKPCDAQLDWRGKMLDFTQTSAALNSGPVQLQLASALQIRLTNGFNLSADLNQLFWRREGQTIYRLEQPCRVSFSQSHDSSRPHRMQFSLDSFRCSGSNREVTASGSINWPQEGQADFTARQFNLDEFRDLFVIPWPNVAVSNLDLQASWGETPLQFSFNLIGDLPGPANTRWSVAANLSGDTNGVEIRPLKLATTGLPEVTVEGNLPVTLLASARGFHTEFDQQKPFKLDATTAAVTNISQSLEEWGTAVLSQPDVSLHLVGPLADLHGTVHAQAARLALASVTNLVSAQKIQQLRVDAQLEPHRVEVNRFSLLVNGQSLNATGDWPLADSSWADLLQNRRLPDWRSATGQVTMTNADLAVLTQYLPTRLVSQGSGFLNLNLSAGGVMQGHLAVSNCTTVPLPSLGPIRDVNLVLRLHGHDAVWTNVVGQIAGAPVVTAGHIDFSEPKQPKFDCTLLATNVALVRKPGLIVRSDLHLRMASTTNQTALVSGEVALRDSLYLQDLDLLAPGPSSAPTRRPPYFSVQAEPFNRWQLDVRITGDRFLRVHTPLFAGEVGANLHLEGTLKDPIALGDVRVPSGHITFPFGTLNVDSGFATLSRQAPHRPTLSINASGEVYGYSIHLQVDGPSDDPRVTFTSTPSLSTGDILLLLTAGQLPQNTSYFSRTDRAERLAVFLGRDLWSRLVGGETGKQRLIIRSGQYISESGKTTYSVEYRLTDRLSLVADYDRFDAFNARIKWKVYSK